MLVCLSGSSMGSFVIRNYHLDCCLAPPGGGCLSCLYRVRTILDHVACNYCKTMAVILGISQLVVSNYIFIIWGNLAGRVMRMLDSSAFWHFPALAPLPKLPSKDFGHPLLRTWLERSKTMLPINVYIYTHRGWMDRLSQLLL